MFGPRWHVGACAYGVGRDLRPTEGTPTVGPTDTGEVEREGSQERGSKGALGGSLFPDETKRTDIY